MQNSFIIFQKLLVLFGFMFIGYLSYKKEWITDHTESQLSGLVLNIFNPALIISGVVGSSENGNWTMVLINLLLAVILFAILIFISPLFVRILRIPKNERNIYSVMLIFSNLGFMGIPIIEELYGKGAIIYVVLYSLCLQHYFLFTYGIYLFEKEKCHCRQGKKLRSQFEWKKMINPGMVSDALAAMVDFRYFRSRRQHQR